MFEELEQQIKTVWRAALAMVEQNAKDDNNFIPVLEQLKRDAMKKGAWQAKLAYAIYFYRSVNQAESSLAKNYLEEVEESDSYYSQKVAEVRDKFAQESSQNTQPDSAKFFFDKSKSIEIFSSELEADYKNFRIQHSKNEIDDKSYMLELKNLLKSTRLSDTLASKIYFQIIKFNLKAAETTGERAYLKEAKKYCYYLIENHSLKDLRKAEKARIIANNLNKILDKSKIDVWSAARKGQMIPTKVFKYIGLIIGNALDLALLFSPKKLAKGEDGKIKVRALMQSDYTDNEFLKNAGIAGAFKYLGKKVGKYIVGLLTGAIGLVIGVVSFPFRYIYRKYNKQEKEYNKTKMYSVLNESYWDIDKGQSTKLFSTAVPYITRKAREKYSDKPCFKGAEVTSILREEKRVYGELFFWSKIHVPAKAIPNTVNANESPQEEASVESRLEI